MFLHAKTDEKQYINLLQNQKPEAWAVLHGSHAYAALYGTASFYQSQGGVIMSLFVSGLPHESGNCKNKIFAVHIHEGNACTGNADDPFANAKTHYNPNNCSHPHHAGDLPPLFESNGTGWYAFFTNHFTIKEILGRAIILHEGLDDFTSQPAGNAGKKIACGIITRI